MPTRSPLPEFIGATTPRLRPILTAIGGVTGTVSGVSPRIPEARGIEAVVQAILENLPQSAGGPPFANERVPVLSGGMSFGNISDFLVYAKGYAAVRLHCPAFAGRAICTVKLVPVAQAEWDELAGSSEREKLCAIARRASAEVDIMVVPSGEMQPDGLRINLLQDELKALLRQEGRWREVARDIRINDGEAVDILRTSAVRTRAATGLPGRRRPPGECGAPDVRGGASGG